ncbi:hypothetical protein JTB14_018313 [Gonioctena quinquepunctata]|nr:hypothetical protein JTB14_018313 [Gonioctena quinquepunctata]
MQYFCKFSTGEYKTHAWKKSVVSIDYHGIVKITSNESKGNESEYKSSIFHERFSALLKDVYIEISKGKSNECYNQNFFNIISTTHLPYYPLRSAFILSNCPASNSLVENDFGQLKTYTLNHQKYLKCSQLVRKPRMDVLSLEVGSYLGIDESRSTEQDPTDEKCSQEKWSRKVKKNDTHFTGRFINQKPHTSTNLIFNEKYKAFLAKLDSTSAERKDLEMSTRAQN